MDQQDDDWRFGDLQDFVFDLRHTGGSSLSGVSGSMIET
jgi:hypothetical protein